jgi:D-alanyl-D-alanine carboxypeptidase (penicillin-binding protein 5/6)
MQVPLLQARPAIHLTFLARPLGQSGATPFRLAGNPLDFPATGPSAVDIPSRGVLVAHDDATVPIASLTKMMLVYVALQKLPLAEGTTGPCHEVTYDDVVTYEDLQAQDASGVYVAEGEQLCELDLLNGVLVHSAGNYAVMLANMVAGSENAMVALMNQEARSLGLDDTLYADVTGLSSSSVSTASDQARLAVLLMGSPLVRAIVDLPSVTLPLVGSVGSFTPYVGIDNVIGVKSGRTDAAGGCDVLALTFIQGDTTQIAYAVVLDQRGGDLLGPAGDAALALAQSAIAGHDTYTYLKGDVFGSLNWDGRRVAVGFTASHDVWTWPGRDASVTIVAPARAQTSAAIHQGQPVATIVLHGVHNRSFVLRALGSLTRPTLLERLR